MRKICKMLQNIETLSLFNLSYCRFSYENVRYTYRLRLNSFSVRQILGVVRFQVLSSDYLWEIKLKLDF